MTLIDIPLQQTYDSDEDDVLRDFYIPVLSEATSYKRLAGFFSSTALAIAARGLKDFILNNGTMQLVTGAQLSERDVKAITNGNEEVTTPVEKKGLQEIRDIDEDFLLDHVKALGWMVENGFLDIRIAVVYNEEGDPLPQRVVQELGIYHMKVGILEDAHGNRMSFCGSCNESAGSWIHNIEYFKVSRDWLEHERESFYSDLNLFRKYWGNGSKQRTKVFELPEAIRRKLLEIAPDDPHDLDLETHYPGTDSGGGRTRITLRGYQEDALESWMANGCTGIFEMATGTGKTFAALGCLRELQRNEERLLTVIAAPYQHLNDQWREEMEKFGTDGEVLIANSSNRGWKREFEDHLLDFQNGITDQLVVLTTHASLRSDDVLEAVRSIHPPSFLIVDEVHGIGAEKLAEGLADDYDYRLGLSATPRRWMDEEGTDRIYRFFGGDPIYEFSMARALKSVNPDTGEPFLSPYEYHAHIVELDSEELRDYEEKTAKLTRLIHAANTDEKEDAIQKAAIERSKIIKNAREKYTKLDQLIDELQPLERTLVYCSPQQIDDVQRLLNEKNIVQHKFTYREDSTPSDDYGGLSEREFILKNFENDVYDALVAIRCLDEGIDLPATKTAIFMANSSNPRRFIQRRGRVLRPHPSKECSYLHDFIVLPYGTDVSLSSVPDIERRIVERELRRFYDFASLAENRIEVLKLMSKIERAYNVEVGSNGE